MPDSMKKQLFFIVLFFIFSNLLCAQNAIKLWSDDMPFSNGTIGDEEMTDAGHVRNVQDPTITVYLPEKKKRAESRLDPPVVAGGGVDRVDQRLASVGFDEDGCDGLAVGGRNLDRQGRVGVG